MITLKSLHALIFTLVALVMAAANVSGYTLISLHRTVEEPVYRSRVIIGEEVHEMHETSHPYSGKGIVWEKKFTWKDAGYISIHFAEFDLAPGDFVEITSPDEEFGYIYQGKGKVVRGGEATLSEFWASHIPGESAIVRLYSTGSAPAYGFTIDTWVHGFEKEVIDELMGKGTEGDIAAICGNDDKQWAPCYEGTEIYEKARAVARLMIGGSSACTGWLLGSEGHLVTNNHCIGTQWDADNTDYEFMAEGETCETDCYGWGACPGIVEASSGDLIKTDYDLDYSLILLETNPAPEYGYLQLREELPEVGETMYIVQHPGAYGKQIATYDDQSGGDCNVYSLNQPPCIGGPGDVGYMCDTEGGSSGSPVLAMSDHFVIALHHCAYCPNRGVRIPPIIEHIGDDMPNDAIGGRDEIRGLVRNSTTGNPMDSVLIEVLDPYKADYTDEFGFYSMQADFPESVRIAASFVGYEADTEWVQVIQEGITYHNIWMNAVNPGYLAGYVRDIDTGIAIGGTLSVTYQGLELTRTHVDGETGYYSLEVPEGTWVVTVDPDNPYMDESEPNVVITMGDTTYLDFDLAPLTEFQDITGAAGILPGGFSQGVSFVDYDGDGDEDIFVVDLMGNNRMYRNDGGVFTEVADSIGLAGVTNGFAGVWGDYDRDRDMDCYVTRRNNLDILFRNDGGVFTDVTALAGVGGEVTDYSQSAAWLDIDNDGKLDLYVANRLGANRLYRNLGGGTFAEEGAAWGVDDTQSAKGVSVVDYDDDGDSDIYVVNMIGGSNVLFRNDGGVFTDVSATAGVGDVGDGRGSTWGDVDGDGDMDLFVANDGPDVLYRNDGGAFTDVTVLAGVGGTGSSYGCNFVDYDNDGDQDLIVTTGTVLLLYLNDGAGMFAEVGGVIGLSGGLGVGIACGDHDADGDLDVYVARSNYVDDLLFENMGNANSWLNVDLRGRKSDRNGIGSRIEAWIGSRVYTRDVVTGTGLYSQNSITSELGVGREAVIDSLIVKWPSGRRTKLSNVASEQSLAISEGGVHRIPLLWP